LILANLVSCERYWENLIATQRDAIVLAESVHSPSGTEVKAADLEDTEEILDQG